MMKEILKDMGISHDEAEQLYNAPILDFIDWVLKSSIQKDEKALFIEYKMRSKDDICEM